MTNRDLLVNGKFSELSLLKTGNLILKDAYHHLPIWTTPTRDSTGNARSVEAEWFRKHVPAK